MESLFLKNDFIYKFTRLYQEIVTQECVIEFEYKRSKSFPFKKEKIEIKSLKRGECLIFAGAEHFLTKIDFAEEEKKIIE